MYCLASLLLAVVCGITVTLGCSREDADIAIAQWTQAFGIGGNVDPRVTINQTIPLFVALMQKDPAIKPLLARVNVNDVHSAEFGAHVLRVVVGFDLCISALNDGLVLNEITSHLAKQHAARVGVKREYILGFFQATLVALPQLADNFNTDAWYNCALPIFEAIAADLH
ncbi:hypothetical protein NP493_330g01015 [Ridgeia piscesae]|uniref:Extracellular globin n=1 Tax=Ridgeia piscesae TaxID=27915 RepID=A0AAD9L3Z5_RIDPI|nr:hypothetical protein NP493_330g01015 [Ridgeia piscesae]